MARRPWTILALAVPAGLAALAATGGMAQPGDRSDDQRRLAEAQRLSAAAAARADRLEAQAAAARDAADQARAREAALGARLERAAADIAAAQARVALARDRLARQRAALVARQGPVVRLVATLQALARRPAVLNVAQPGSTSDMVHVNAVLASVLPVVRARTADIRADLRRSRALADAEARALADVAAGRTRLDEQRLALIRLAARNRRDARALGREALVESDRAIALGETARDLAERIERSGAAAAIGADLAALPGPLPRPPRPGDADAPPALAAAPYRLPVAGRVVTGFGELSSDGVRSRGVTIAVAAGAPIAAPAAGRVVFARPFRDYGPIVIIDHGGGWTSLIAGLGDIGVEPGARIAQGRPIGHAATGEAARVTIELRRRNRPIDLTRLIG